MTTETLTVPEIHCDHCKESIEGAVGALRGVDRVDVSVAARTVDVTYDEARVGRGDIVAAVEEQGYEVPA